MCKYSFYLTEFENLYIRFLENIFNNIKNQIAYENFSYWIKRISWFQSFKVI